MYLAWYSIIGIVIIAEAIGMMLISWINAGTFADKETEIFSLKKELHDVDKAYRCIERYIDKHLDIETGKVVIKKIPQQV